MIAHHLPAQVPHVHATHDEVAACEWDHRELLARLARHTQH